MLQPAFYPGDMDRGLLIAADGVLQDEFPNEIREMVTTATKSRKLKAYVEPKRAKTT